MKRNFTKLIILCLIAGTSFTACKKSSNSKPADNSSNTESMKFTLNGKAVSYDNCIISDESITGQKQFGLLGAGEKDDNFLSIVVYADIKNLKAGDTFNAASSIYQPNGMVINYSADANDSFYTVTGVPQGSVTFTEVTSTVIKGTFTTAKLYDFFDDKGTDLKYTVSNGSFTASRPTN